MGWKFLEHQSLKLLFFSNLHSSYVSERNNSYLSSLLLFNFSLSPNHFLLSDSPSLFSHYLCLRLSLPIRFQHLSTLLLKRLSFLFCFPRSSIGLFSNFKIWLTLPFPPSLTISFFPGFYPRSLHVCS